MIQTKNPPDDLKLLPEVVITNFYGIASGGATQPVKCECLTPSGEKQKYLVKFENKVTQKGCVCEAVGFHLARLLRLNVPDAAWASVHPELIKRPDSYRRFGIDPIGCHFASLYREQLGRLQRTSLQFPRTSHIEHAKRIFVFDMLSQNPDRTFDESQGKPNTFLSSDNELVVLDHEKAFPFASVYLLGAPQPWEIDTQPWVHSHVFRETLRSALNSDGSETFFEEALTLLDKIESSDLQAIEHELPSAWKSTGVYAKIEEHVLKVKANLKDFERCLLRIVAR